MVNRWRLLFIVFFFLLLSGALQTLGKHREGLTRVESLKDEVGRLETANESLQKERSYRETAAFVEKEARDKLKMVKEGEHLVVLPENLPVLGAEATASSASARPVWRQWIELFFGKRE